MRDTLLAVKSIFGMMPNLGCEAPQKNM